MIGPDIAAGAEEQGVGRHECALEGDKVRRLEKDPAYAEEHQNNVKFVRDDAEPYVDKGHKKEDGEKCGKKSVMDRAQGRVRYQLEWQYHPRQHK